MRLITVQNKIISVTVGIVLIFAPFLFIYFPNQQKDLLTEEYRREVNNIATTVALGVNIALDEQSFEGVETSMQHAKDDDRLTFVALVQVDTINNYRDKINIKKSAFSIFPEDYPFKLNVESSDSVVVSSAKIDSEFLSGEVVVGFSTKSITAAIDAFLFQSFIGSLIISLFGIILGVLLARSISRPILRLKNATHLVAEGDLSQNVKVKSKDEIGDLSISFNIMVEKLEKSENQLKLQKALVEQKNQDMVDSIIYAKKIQEAILPSIKSVKERFNDSFVLYMPKDIVSGDFYWMQTIVERTLISVADCTGHGVPGAFVSLVSSNAMNTSVRGFGLANPAAILDQTNSIMRQHFDNENDERELRDGMDLSLVSIVKDESTIEYAGALNPLWIISPIAPVDNSVKLEPSESHKRADLYEVKADKQPIGRYIHQNPFTNHIIELNKGDVIYLYSDGFADQFGGERGKKFKAKTFKKLLLELWELPLEEQSELLKKAIVEWMGDNEQLDDICIIGIRI